MPSKNYKIQIEVNDTIYNSWKRFLTMQGYVLYGGVTRLNKIAMERGIKTLMKNKKLLKQMLEEDK